MNTGRPSRLGGPMLGRPERDHVSTSSGCDRCVGFDEVRAIGLNQCFGQRGANRVSAHACLLGFGEGAAAGTTVNNVAVGKSLSAVHFFHAEHAHADINNNMRRAVDINDR